MKKFLLGLLIMAMAAPAFSQKVDSIYFHLYTDSLKKGQYNYINVDGKLSNGKWLPLTDRELVFTCDEAKFEGNQVIIPENFTPQKISIKASLRSDPSVFIERTVWIKQKPDPFLPTESEVMNPNKKRKN
jgi:hypothetical protein